MHAAKRENSFLMNDSLIAKDFSESISSEQCDYERTSPTKTVARDIRLILLKKPIEHKPWATDPITVRREVSM